MPYFTYIAHCADETFYIGYTKDLKRREIEHNSSDKGAKYTRGRRPVKIVYSEKFKTVNEALKREYQLKKLSRKEKIKRIYQ